MKNLGGNFDAVQGPNGQWTVKDVPIFSELPAGVRKNPEPVDVEWMKLAVGRARQLMAERNRQEDQEGYRAPLHVRHHDGASDTEYAGKIELTGVKRIVYMGRQVWAIFADLVAMPDAIYQRVKRGELAFRSVEVANWGTPEIASCSLLPDEAPFFKLSPLTIKTETTAMELPAVTAVAAGSPALAFRGVGDGGMALFSFRGGYQMAEEEKAHPSDCKCKDCMEKSEHGAPPPEKKEMAGGAEEKKPGGEPAEAAPQKDYSRKAYKALKLMLPMLHAMAGKMGVQLQPQAVGADKEGKGPEADDDKGPYEQPDKEKEGSKMAEESGVKLATLAAEVSALKQTVDKREVADKTAAMVAAAKVQLKGYTVSEEIEKRLHEFAAAGQPLLDSYVATFKSVAVKDPPATFAEYESGGAKLEFPEAVMKFSAKGPEELEKAKKHFRNWDALGKYRPAGMTVERFIELEMAHAE